MSNENLELPNSYSEALGELAEEFDYDGPWGVGGSINRALRGGELDGVDDVDIITDSEGYQATVEQLSDYLTEDSGWSCVEVEGQEWLYSNAEFEINGVAIEIIGDFRVIEGGEEKEVYGLDDSKTENMDVEGYEVPFIMPEAELEAHERVEGRESETEEWREIVNS